MPMRIDHAWHYNRAGRVDLLCLIMVKVLTDLSDASVHDQNIPTGHVADRRIAGDDIAVTDQDRSHSFVPLPSIFVTEASVGCASLIE
jgi:hypothetical protein